MQLTIAFKTLLLFFDNFDDDIITLAQFLINTQRHIYDIKKE
jgi:hypothetical protein